MGTCLSIVYVGVCSNAMAVFACTKQADGRRTMNEDPSISCTSKLWHRMIAGACFILIVFGVLFPLGILGMLYQARGRLWQQRYLLAYGMLYKHYKSSFYFFKPIDLYRKLAFVTGIAIFRRSATASAGPMTWALIVSIITVSGTFYFAPFEDINVTRLETLAQCCACFVLTIGLVFYGASTSMSSAASNTLGSFIVIVIALTLIVIVLAILKSVALQRDLVRRGVTGGFGTDRLKAAPLFFDLDVRIQKLERCVTATAAIWHMELQFNKSVMLASSITQIEIGIDPPAFELARTLFKKPNASSSGNVPLISRRNALNFTSRAKRRAVEKDLRDLLGDTEMGTIGTWTSAGTELEQQELKALPPAIRYTKQVPQHDGTLWHMFYLLPCRGVYEVQICLDSKDGALRNKPAIVDIAISADTGCSPDQRIVTCTPAFGERNGLLLSPLEHVLEAGRSHLFSVRVNSARDIFVSCITFSFARGCFVRTYFPLYMGDEGIRERAVEVRFPGRVQVWAHPSDDINQWNIGGRPPSRPASSALSPVDALLSELVLLVEYQADLSANSELSSDVASALFRGDASGSRMPIEIERDVSVFRASATEQSLGDQEALNAAFGQTSNAARVMNESFVPSFMPRGAAPLPVAAQSSELQMTSFVAPSGGYNFANWTPNEAAAEPAANAEQQAGAGVAPAPPRMVDLLTPQQIALLKRQLPVLPAATRENYEGEQVTIAVPSEAGPSDTAAAVPAKPPRKGQKVAKPAKPALLKKPEKRGG
eukprot:c7616_g1_i1.p1 GENE.c7616_g1_i1~~c7616_g1_i1.p1  ORF type:complete len:768 (+),score=90.86 c7616_g1_i1:1-2304(+)